MAIKYLFGEAWLPYVTIAVVGSCAPSEADMIHQLQDPSSPFYPLHAGGAKIRRLTLQIPQIQDILMEFDTQSTDPAFYSRVRYNWRANRYDGLDKLVDQALDIAHNSNRTSFHARRITFEESENSRQQLQLALTDAEAELKSLRAQLEQTRLEYGQLRSELQLNDNTELNRIVQSLKTLNRGIEDFGRTMAQYLVDNYCVGYIDNNENTTLPGTNLAGLKAQFKHQEGEASLIASPDGIGLPVEDFLDLALRSILCQRLHECIFLPFHPILGVTTESTFITSLYEEVRRYCKCSTNTYITFD